MNGESTILIVDDNEGLRKFLKELSEQEGYTTMLAADGKEAVETAETGYPDLILMDAMMPREDGFEATRKIRAQDHNKYTPIIMLTGKMTSQENKLQGIKAGATDFLTKPVDNDELLLRIENNLKIRAYHTMMEKHNTLLEERVAERTRKLQEALHTLKNTNEDIKNSYRETIFKLTIVGEYRDEDTGTHIKRIGYYAREIASGMGMEPSFKENIFYSAPMHDIGKVGIPDNILLKPGKLTAREWETMKNHTTIGATILNYSSSPYLIMGKVIAHSHHEKWNGKGYPLGLAGESIPLEGRIVNIVDQYDSLRSKRPYKPPFSHEKAVEIITRGDKATKPDHFDPEILSVFRRSCNKFREIFETFMNEPEGEDLFGNGGE